LKEQARYIPPVCPSAESAYEKINAGYLMALRHRETNDESDISNSGDAHNLVISSPTIPEYVVSDDAPRGPDPVPRFIIAAILPF
jgi:hypothetical protein